MNHGPLLFKIQFHQFIAARDFELDFLINCSENECLRIQDDIANELSSDHGKPYWYVMSILHRVLKVCQDKLSDSISELFASLAIKEQSQGGPALKQIDEEVNVRYYYSPTEYIDIDEHPSALLANGTTGHRTWEASLALSEYLLLGPELIDGHNILELGAGTGLVSLLCDRLGANKIVATDGSEVVVSALQRRIAREASKNMTSCVLRFGENCETLQIDFDLLVAADVTYDETVISQLLETILTGFARNEAMVVLLAATVRNPETQGRVMSSLIQG